ncbi:MAG TPA: DUF1592 domain-containing protein [Planctomycetota bacterium]|nr:DUF1592 domain-containing protein [Planctomycetota bacterium]
MRKGRASAAALLLFLPLLVSAAPLTKAAPPPAPPEGLAVGAQDEADAVLKPIVAKHCLSCHGAKKPKADLDLTPFTTEASVRAKGKLWQLAARMVRSHEMPPADKKPSITADERERFAKAVDAILLRIDPKAPVNPGRVTLRRLNRAEYRNTMRDLLGVDFDPAEDFPSDDIGHGFDNIGDVLSLPPVLMERYLTAAEAVVQRAFPAEPPKPSEQHTGAKYLQPAGKNVPPSKFRPLSGGKGDAVETGPLYNEYRLRDGDYLFRFRAFAKPKGAKVAVLACGKDVPSPASDADADRLAGAAVRALRPFRIVETVSVDHDQEKGSRRYEVKIPPMPGVEKIALAVVKGPEGQPAPEVHVESFVLYGPLDPRPAFQREALKAVDGKPKAEQTRQFLRTFASRAWRRPVTDEELGRLVEFAERAEAGGARWEGALGLAMQGILCSPKFLFRAELDDRPQLPQAHPITEHQLASRLSYFIWQSMPDDELLSLASKSQLSANLEKQVRRMLKDPKADALVDGFAMQWLQLQRLSTAAPDPKMFPQFQYLRGSMRRETELFVQSVFREDRSVLDLVSADYTFLDERLARFYGIKDTMGNRDGRKPARPGGQPIPRRDFVRVQLADADRGGLLTHASILTVTSNPTRTSPVKRGRWVLEQILGEPPPPPPPDVPELEESAEAQKSGSLKQRLEQHRRDPRCANCHARMDAIGFALENFDPIGAYRWKDGSFDIDASGAFPDGTVVKGVAGLRQVVVANKDLFVRCLVEKLLTFALGRGVEPYDAPAVRKIQEALAKDGYKFSRLVLEIARSDPFRLRRGTSQTD